MDRGVCVFGDRKDHQQHLEVEGSGDGRPRNLIFPLVIISSFVIMLYHQTILI